VITKRPVNQPTNATIPAEIAGNPRWAEHERIRLRLKNEERELITQIENKLKIQNNQDLPKLILEAVSNNQPLPLDMRESEIGTLKQKFRAIGFAHTLHSQNGLRLQEELAAEQHNQNLLS
jgi:hypothetical protein